MNDTQLETVITALELASQHTEGADKGRFDVLLRQLRTETWQMEVWRDGELWDVLDAPDPVGLLDKMVHYRSWDDEIEGCGDVVTAWNAVSHLWQELDLSFTLLRRHHGPVEVAVMENGEQIVAAAAKAQLLGAGEWGASAPAGQVV
jgi:hypothetical protein